MWLHHGMDQVRSLELRKALETRVGVQLIGGSQAMDARQLSMMLGVSDQLLTTLKGARRERPVAEFALRVGTKLPSAVKVKIPIGSLQNAERMSDADWRWVIDQSRDRYGSPLAGPPPPQSAADNAQPTTTIQALPAQVTRPAGKAQPKQSPVITPPASGDDDWFSSRE